MLFILACCLMNMPAPGQKTLKLTGIGAVSYRRDHWAGMFGRSGRVGSHRLKLTQYLTKPKSGQVRWRQLCLVTDKLLQGTGFGQSAVKAAKKEPFCIGKNKMKQKRTPLCCPFLLHLVLSDTKCLSSADFTTLCQTPLLQVTQDQVRPSAGP